MAVNKFTNGAGGNTWNTAGNWSLGSIPTASDGHVATFDATSPNCTLGGNRTCNNIDFTGYTNTLTMSTNSLTVAGNVTFDTGLIISGSGQMILTQNGTITSNGYTWPNDLNSTTNTKTVTLVGNFAINGGLIISTNAAITINKTTSETFSCNGISHSTNGRLEGTALKILTGGTWTSTVSSGYVSGDLTITGNTTIGTNVWFTNGTMTYSSGTVTTTSSTLNLLANAVTFDTSGITWNNVILAPTAQTYTINSSFDVSGTLNMGTTGGHIFTGTHGFNANIVYLSSTSANTTQFKEAVTYTIYGELRAYESTEASASLFTSSHGSTKAKIVMPNNGSNLCRTNLKFTRIDASGGRSICTFGGTITDCINIIQYYDYPPVAA